LQTTEIIKTCAK